MNKDMIEVYESSFEETEGGCHYHMGSEEAVQAIINAAWHTYDWRDNTTWPQELDILYLTRNSYGQYHTTFPSGFQQRHVVSYLNISDITQSPNVSEEKNND